MAKSLPRESKQEYMTRLNIFYTNIHQLQLDYQYHFKYEHELFGLLKVIRKPIGLELDNLTSSENYPPEIKDELVTKCLQIFNSTFSLRQ